MSGPSPTPDGGELLGSAGGHVVGAPSTGLADPQRLLHVPSAATVDGIVTPEAVVLDLETAGVASRVAAGLLDLVIAIAIYGALMIVLAFVVDESSTLDTLAAIAGFAMIFAYPMLFETLMRGRTPGKAAFGLRVVTEAGAPVRFRHVALRAMGGIVDRLLPPGGITGALFVLWTRRHQRIGDLLAGTIVIADPALFRASPALWFSPPPHLVDYAAGLDPTAITVDQYTVVRTFLTRAPGLQRSVRTQVAAHIADELARVMHHAIPAAVDPETFLVCAMAQYQRRSGAGASVR